MTRRALEMAGKRVGRLVVLERSALTDSHKRALWRCRCDCGAEAVVVGDYLRRGLTRSCGCLRRARFISNMIEGRRRAAAKRRNQAVGGALAAPRLPAPVQAAAKRPKGQEWAAAGALDLAAALGYGVVSLGADHAP